MGHSDTYANEHVIDYFTERGKRARAFAPPAIGAGPMPKSYRRTPQDAVLQARYLAEWDGCAAGYARPRYVKRVGGHIRPCNCYKHRDDLK